MCFFFFFKQKTAYEMRISDWSSDVCSSDLRALGRQVRLLDGSDDLELLGCGIPHSSLSPSATMLFLSRRVSSVRSATHSFRARASRRRSWTSPVVAARAVSPARRRLPASRSEENTSELQSLMRLSYAVFCCKTKIN